MAMIPVDEEGGGFGEKKGKEFKQMAG